jgi:hypothetical protein
LVDFHNYPELKKANKNSKTGRAIACDEVFLEPRVILYLLRGFQSIISVSLELDGSKNIFG